MHRSQLAHVYSAGGGGKTIITPPFQKAPQRDLLMNPRHYSKRKSRSSNLYGRVASRPSLFPSDTRVNYGPCWGTQQPAWPGGKGDQLSLSPPNPSCTHQRWTRASRGSSGGTARDRAPSPAPASQQEAAGSSYARGPMGRDLGEREPPSSRCPGNTSVPGRGCAAAELLPAEEPESPADTQHLISGRDGEVDPRNASPGGAGLRHRLALPSTTPAPPSLPPPGPPPHRRAAGCGGEGGKGPPGSPSAHGRGRAGRSGNCAESRRVPAAPGGTHLRTAAAPHPVGEAAVGNYRAAQHGRAIASAAVPGPLRSEIAASTDLLSGGEKPAATLEAGHGLGAAQDTQQTGHAADGHPQPRPA